MSLSIVSRPSSSSGTQQPAAHVADPQAGRPVQPLDQAARFEPEVADAEHLQRLLARLQCVVITLDQPPIGDRAIGVEQVLDGLRHVARAAAHFLFDLVADLEAVELRAAQHVEDSRLWCAAIARPDSLTMIGCSTPRALQTLPMR